MAIKKVNILLDHRGEIYPGWLNIDPLAPANDPQRIKHTPEDLSALVQPASLEALRALDVLDYYPAQKADQVLDHWISLLGHQGTLAISCVDILEVSRALQRRLIDIPLANSLLHGEQKQNWDHRCANYSLGQLASVLENKGLHILVRRIFDFRAILVAKRP